MTGELKQWHKVTLTLDGPFAHERDKQPNPFTDLAFNVTFTHESGSPEIQGARLLRRGWRRGEHQRRIRHEMACASLAGQSGRSGTTPFPSPEAKTRRSKAAASRSQPFDGMSGSFTIAASDKTGRDFRAQGRLQYVGKHHLQFAGSKEYFLKAGPDAPETLLGLCRLRQHQRRQA